MFARKILKVNFTFSELNINIKTKESKNMLKFYSLYSGSSGNSLLVKTENTNILVDAGVSSKKIETALTNLEIDPSSLDGILITHEHSRTWNIFKKIWYTCFC